MADDTPDHTPGRTTRQADTTGSDLPAPRAPVSGPAPVGWATALRRALALLLPRQRTDRVPGWSSIVPIVLLLAGLLFATTAETARGTDLRTDRRAELRDLIGERRDEVAELAAERRRLAREVEEQTRRFSGSDGRIPSEQRRGDKLRSPAGLTALHGPGLVVTLDDAPRRPDAALPRDATPDDLVVHQQDVQAVVNALWAGGAEAMSIMDVRVVSTSAVICVGPTLFLHGRVYSPPFRIAVIGDTRRMLAMLDQSPGVRLYRAAAEDFGLGYDTAVEEDVQVPAFDGTEGLNHARVKR